MLLKKKIIVSTVCGILCLSSITLFLGGGAFSKSTAYADIAQGKVMAEVNNGESTFTANTIETDLKAPSLIIEKYYTAACFSWTAGTGSTGLSISSSGYDWDFLNKNTLTYNDIQFADIGSQLVYPQYKYAKSYDSVNNRYSGETSAFHTYYDENNVLIITAQRECSYTVVGATKWGIVIGDVPTSFDQTDYIWNHGGKSGNIIKGTIRLDNSYVSNIEVSIPLIGYKSTSVTLNGVTISLRTGPNRCSIKVGQDNINAYRLTFAFGVQK